MSCLALRPSPALTHPALRWPTAVLLAALLALAGCDAAAPTPPAACPPGARTTAAARTASERADGWEFLGLQADTLFRVSSAAASPFEPDLLLAGTAQNFSAGIPGYLFRSTDGGTSWQAVLAGGSYRNITFSPAEPEVAFAVPDGIVKTTDGGQTWMPADDGIINDFDTDVQTLAFDPHDPTGQTLYAGTGGFFGGTLYRSTDGGATWAETTDPPPTCEDPFAPDCRLRAGVFSLALDPEQEGVVYAGTAFQGDILKSEDGGRTWALGFDNSGSLVNALVLDAADPETVYASFSIGDLTMRVWRSLDGAATWAPYYDGLPSPLNAGRMVQDPVTRTLYLLADYFPQGIATVWQRVPGMMWEAFGPEDILIGRSGGLHLSTDGQLYAGGPGLWRKRVRGSTAAEPGPCPP